MGELVDWDADIIRTIRTNIYSKPFFSLLWQQNHYFTMVEINILSRVEVGVRVYVIDHLEGCK